MDQGDFIDVAPLSRHLRLLLQLREIERALSICLFVWSANTMPKMWSTVSELEIQTFHWFTVEERIP